jgi:hypothetical protein
MLRNGRARILFATISTGLAAGGYRSMSRPPTFTTRAVIPINNAVMRAGGLA